MLTSTGRELTVVGYRPASSTDTERLRRENDRLRRAMRAERRKRMAAYERALSADRRRRRWWQDHRAEVIGGLCLWHFVELGALCLFMAWICTSIVG